uniref:Uncharacterized protein n=1 Tax=Oryza sativa subsp. japonica TaxID=39947 RepID=Q8H3F1_ORYSJ|nr:hypothetical protein [Oryza sativa Japonica Group]BAD32042.1 hypothetical protein [Oryza sativa Japonica Group]
MAWMVPSPSPRRLPLARRPAGTVATSWSPRLAAPPPPVALVISRWRQPAGRGICPDRTK